MKGRRRGWKVLGIVVVVILLLVLVGPFLVPVPPLADTVPAAELADEDGRFIAVNGLQVHYKEAGEGEPVILLLHGFAAHTFTWSEVLEPLSAYGRVIAYDRPGFGFTERPLSWEGPNPYAAQNQPELLVALLDELGVEQAILIGNSAGGAVALDTALSYPERVQSLVLVDPAVYVGTAMPAWVRLLANTPQGQRLGPLFTRSIAGWGYEFGLTAWHDDSKFTDAIWDGYRKPLRAENWDRALWQVTSGSRPIDLEPRFGELSVPVLVVTGDADRIVPTEQSIRLAQELPNADLLIIPECGHVPNHECPEAFMDGIRDWEEGIGGSGSGTGD